jgi:lipoate-protein ligase A
MARITGRIELLINGQLQLTKSGSVTVAGLGLSGSQNYVLKEVIGDTGVQGFIEEPVPATCEMTITDRDDIKVDTIARIRENGTIVVRAAGGGKVYTMNGATCTRNISLKSGEGETTVKFIGNNWVETVESAA